MKICGKHNGRGGSVRRKPFDVTFYANAVSHGE